MPSPIVNFSASITCCHGGTTMPASPAGRVKVSGQPVVTVSTSYTVVSCPFYPPYGNGPCVYGQWTNASTRVKVDGQPVILQQHQGTCTPTGTSLIVASTQTQATAT